MRTTAPETACKSRMKPIKHPHQLSRVVLQGYKSVAKCDLALGMLNVLIGANGAGKSNFIGFFRLNRAILDQRLQTFVAEMGGPDALLHFGRKSTEELQAELYFGNNGYRYRLKPTQDNRMMFTHEALWWNQHGDQNPCSGHFESDVEEQKQQNQIYDLVVPAMQSWQLYHFHDTSVSARVKQVATIYDNVRLREDASNLAAFLYRLQQQYSTHYQRIVKVVRLVAPFFGDFHLRPSIIHSETIQLEWTEIGEDLPFTASALSDGTLRFICLATVLLQPDECMPTTLLIDEPELGLHPYAITILAGLVHSAAQQHQIIISTQSVELVNAFDADDLIVIDKQSKASSFRRLDVTALGEWLADYSLGDLWKKNLLGGRPTR